MNVTLCSICTVYQELVSNSVPSTASGTSTLTGKTTLCSSVVDALSEKGKKLVLYFYCKHDQSGKNRFSDILRSSLAQLARRDTILAARLHDACTSNDQSSISSILEPLGEIAFESQKECFLIIDGLDECLPLEAENLIRWLSSRVNEANRLRILFAGQRTDLLLEHLKTADHISLDAHEHKEDISKYVIDAARALKDQFDISKETETHIVAQVTHRANSK